jgi:hypothetical protein
MELSTARVPTQVPLFPGQFLEVSSARARLRFYVVQIGLEGRTSVGLVSGPRTVTIDCPSRREMTISQTSTIRWPPFRKTIRAGRSDTHMPNDELHYSTATVTRKYVAGITVVSLLELLF